MFTKVENNFIIYFLAGLFGSMPKYFIGMFAGEARRWKNYYIKS